MVGGGLVDLVADERDGPGVAAERRARERQAEGGGLESGADAVAPRPVVAGVVDLVEHDERVAGLPGQDLAAGGDLLERGDDAVQVAGQGTVGG